MSSWQFIEPLDVLTLRGNKLFGDAGSYGESLIPPWPSVAAGAIRSDLLVRSGIDLAAFAKGDATHPELGAPSEPGPFRVTHFGLARSKDEKVVSLHPVPADLVISETAPEKLVVKRLKPQAPGKGISSSSLTSKMPVLAESQRSKPVTGYWLDQTGYADYLAGKLPVVDSLLSSSALWQLDERVGVGLDGESRRADDGKLFTTQSVAFCEDVGFVTAVSGAQLPDDALLRFGGDGRGARMRSVDFEAPMADLDAIAQSGRCRIVLTSPGLFPDGWRLPGMAEDGAFALSGVTGRIVAAAVSRSEVVSGWDLARWQPKPAQRAAPTGSVYWIEDLHASSAALRKLANHGLWLPEDYDAQRRAEGFNRFDFAAY